MEAKRSENGLVGAGFFLGAVAGGLVNALIVDLPGIGFILGGAIGGGLAFVVEVARRRR